MGSSASFMRFVAHECFEEIFVNDALVQGCSLLKYNVTMRDQFVEFVKGDSWLADVADYERTPTFINLDSCSVWRRYGYRGKCPPSRPLSISSVEADPIRGEIATERNQTMQLKIFTESHEAMAVLVMILYPIFAARNMQHFDSVTDFSFSDRLSPSAQHESKHKPRHSRLQQTLLSMAKACESSELRNYLARDSTSYIDDFSHALASMPVKMMVCKVDPEQKTSSVVFASYVLNDVDKAAMGLRLCEQDVVGQDLHVLCGNMCSPGSAQQLERAVFAGKTFKQRVELPNGQCKLLAVFPVHKKAHSGQAAYTVSLESEPFSEPPDAGCGESPEEVASALETHFQQIEDAMMLMPVLLRC